MGAANNERKTNDSKFSPTTAAAAAIKTWAAAVKA